MILLGEKNFVVSKATASYNIDARSKTHKNMDYEVIIYLLKGRHIGIQERTEMGIWPHPPLRFSELVSQLAGYLQNEKWFPEQWVERYDGELIDNKVSIEKISDKEYIYRARECDPRDITRIKLKTQKTFRSAREAAEYYMRNALNLPGRLDKWKVIE